MDQKTVLIFGATGQTGSYLAELLIDMGYKVVGVSRRSSTNNTCRLSSLLENKSFELVEGDVTDCFCIASLLTRYKPVEVYNMAAQSHVATSFKQPALTWDVTAGGCLNILEAIRNIDPTIKFYQASSSEMFGKNYSTKYVAKKLRGVLAKEPIEVPDLECDEVKYQDEDTPMFPQSPYAIAKLAAHHLVRNYRDSYGIFACSGILFNHESPRRGEQFVTRKITKWIGDFLNKVKVADLNTLSFTYSHILELGEELFPKLRLGNLDAKRDWGHAKDYCRAIKAMMDHEKPDDYVISTGETHTIKEFLEKAFTAAGLGDYRNFVVIDKEFFRPAEVDYLRGDSSKARTILGWEPDHSFNDLVQDMVESDIHGSEKRRCRSTCGSAEAR